MDTALIIGVIGIFSALFAWFLNRLFSNVDKRFESMEKQNIQQFKNMEKQMENIEKQNIQRLENMEKQMENIEKQNIQRLENMEKQMENMEKQNIQRLENMEKQFEGLERLMLKYFEELKSENKEIRHQVYNHIPTQIRELEKASQERDKKIDDIKVGIKRIENKIDQ